MNLHEIATLSAAGRTAGLCPQNEGRRAGAVATVVALHERRGDQLSCGRPGTVASETALDSHRSAELFSGLAQLFCGHPRAVAAELALDEQSGICDVAVMSRQLRACQIDVLTPVLGGGR